MKEIYDFIIEIGAWILLAILFLSIIGYIYRGIKYKTWSKPFYGPGSDD